MAPMLTGLLAKTPAPAHPAVVPATHHVHIPGLGYWALLAVGLIAGFLLGRVWDELVGWLFGWLFDTTAIVRRWVEAALVLAGVVFVVYAVLRWGFHAA